MNYLGDYDSYTRQVDPTASPSAVRRFGVARAVLVGSLVVLALAACSSPPDVILPTPTSSSGPSTEPQPAFGTIGAYSTAVWVDGAYVEPTVAIETVDSQVAQEDELLADMRAIDIVDKDVRATAVNSDGVVAGVRAQFTGDLSLIQSATGVIGPRGVFEQFPTVTPEGVDPGLARQAESMAINEEYVAWVETPSTDLYFDDWAVFAADLATGTTVSLASSQDVLPGDTLPIVGPYVYVTIGDTRAWWGTPYPRGEKGPDGHFSDFGLEILGRNLDGTGDLEVVADGAILPAASGGECVVFARVAGSDPSVPEGTYALSEVCENGEERRLIEGELGAQGKISVLAAGYGLVAWSIREDDDAGMTSRADLLVYDRSEGVLTVLNQSPGDDGFINTATNVAVGDGIVQWQSADHMLYDVANASSWRLPGENTGSTTQFLGGRWLGWIDLEGDGNLVSLARWVR